MKYNNTQAAAGCQCLVSFGIVVGVWRNSLFYGGSGYYLLLKGEKLNITLGKVFDSGRYDGSYLLDMLIPF